MTPEFVKREGMIADTEYIQWLSDVKKRFRQSQGRALVKVNAEMLDFYWSIGRDLLHSRQRHAGEMVLSNNLHLICEKLFPMLLVFRIQM